MKGYEVRNDKFSGLTDTTNPLNYEHKFNLLVALIKGLENNVHTGSLGTRYGDGAKDVLRDLVQQIEQLENV